MKAYISGQISGINMNLARSRFSEAEQLLRSVGFEEIFNPMSVQGKFDTWEQYMRHDIAELMKCDVIYMLDGWEKSRGARIEHNLMKTLQLPILYEKERRGAFTQELRSAIARACNTTVAELLSEKRTRTLVYARMLCAVVFREHNYSFHRIAAAMNRNHSTIMYYCKHHDDELEYNDEYRELYSQVVEVIENEQLTRIFDYNEA